MGRLIQLDGGAVRYKYDFWAETDPSEVHPRFLFIQEYALFAAPLDGGAPLKLTCKMPTSAERGGYALHPMTVVCVCAWALCLFGV